MDKDTNSTPQHLLIVRFSAMSDVAMLAHVVRALRVNHPTLRVSMLTQRLFEPLFKGLDVNFIPVDLDGRHSGFTGMRRLACEISEMDIDCVADMQSVLRTTLFRVMLKFQGVTSAYLRKDKVSKWMRMDGGCQDMTKPLKHTVERYCDVLRDLGFEVDNPAPIEKIERPNPMPYDKGSERWIGVAPFSVHEGKRYPLHLVRRLIPILLKKYDRLFIHSGGGKELKFAEEMAATYDRVEAVYSQITLAQEIDLISNEDCIVSMDSFTMHVASLVVTPVVSIWGATHPLVGFSGYGCDPEGYVQLDLPCRPCSTFGNKRCRMRDYNCLHDITPESVAERVDYIIEKYQV